MTWVIIPIIGFVIILCIVVKGHVDEQAKMADLEYRKRHERKFTPEEYVTEEYDIECETRDEPILKRSLNETD